jgi:hypothetical protein
LLLNATRHKRQKVMPSKKSTEATLGSHPRAAP